MTPQPSEGALKWARELVSFSDAWSPEREAAGALLREAARPSLAVLEDWSREVRLTIRGIDAQAERLTHREQTTWRDGDDQQPRDEDFEEIINGYKLNTGLWHRLLGLLACCPAPEGPLQQTSPSPTANIVQVLPLAPQPPTITTTSEGGTPRTDAHLSHLNLPNGTKIGLPTVTLDLLRQLERELAEAKQTIQWQEEALRAEWRKSPERAEMVAAGVITPPSSTAPFPRLEIDHDLVIVYLAYRESKDGDLAKNVQRQFDACVDYDSAGNVIGIELFNVPLPSVALDGGKQT